jgi:hypothetical protein
MRASRHSGCRRGLPPSAPAQGQPKTSTAHWQQTCRLPVRRVRQRPPGPRFNHPNLTSGPAAAAAAEPALLASLLVTTEASAAIGSAGSRQHTQQRSSAARLFWGAPWPMRTWATALPQPSQDNPSTLLLLPPVALPASPTRKEGNALLPASPMRLKTDAALLLCTSDWSKMLSCLLPTSDCSILHGWHLHPCDCS